MPRRPLGTYVRTTADWFLNESNTTGARFKSGGTATYFAWSLYNADQHGRVIILDGIDIFSPGSEVLTCAPYGVDGNLLTSGNPIVAGNPQAAGEIWSWNSVDSPPPLTLGVPTALAFDFGTEQGSPMQVRARGPLAYLKPGYSYCVFNSLATTTYLTVNFYYSVLSQ